MIWVLNNDEKVNKIPIFGSEKLNSSFYNNYSNEVSKIRGFESR